ncbi:MAG: alcohol dehydrogenase catalytic domain-containing protein [Dehalogenimonas sp.]
MSKEMRAAVLESPGVIGLKSLVIPVCPKEGLLVKVKAAAICSTDASMFTLGHRDLIYPRILGHEIAGVVIQSQNPLFLARDRVQIYPGVCCGVCVNCIKGDVRHCLSLKILGFSVDGGFAEIIAISNVAINSGGINKIPDHITEDEASLTEPLASCINAQEKLNVGKGDHVLIIGAGPLGLLHGRLAAYRGAEKVVIAERIKHRVESAFSTTDSVVHIGINYSLSSTMAYSNGRGFNVVIPASRQLSVAQLLPLMADNGRLSLFSGLQKKSELTGTDVNLIHYRELQLCGAYGSTSVQNTEALKLIGNGFFIGDIITARFGLEEIIEGFLYTSECRGLKALIYNPS